MPLDISYDEICSKFDRLVSNGIIQYQPSHPVIVTDNGMTVCSHRYRQLRIVAFDANVDIVLFQCG